MRRTILLASTLAIFGCGNRNFNTPQLLNIPRILAIQAEPPQPKVGESTTLQTLVYLPPSDTGVADLVYRWKWCPLPTSSNDGYQCPIDQSPFDKVYAAIGSPSLDLASVGTTATFVNPFPATFLAAICSGDFSSFPGMAGAGEKSLGADGGAKSPFGCLAGVGFPVTIQLYIDNFPGGNAASGLPDAVSTIYLPTDDSAPGNQNPIIGGIQATWADAPDGGSSVVDAGTPLFHTPSSSIDAEMSAVDTEDFPDDGGSAIVDAGTQPFDASPSSVDADMSVVDAGAFSDSGGSPQPPDAASPIAIPSSDSDGVLLDKAASTTVPRQKQIKLHLQVPIDSSEPMAAAQIAAIKASQEALSNQGYKPTATEQLTFRWFAEAGDFGDRGEGGRTTAFVGTLLDGSIPGFADAISNWWALPKKEDYAGDTSRLIVVVRDNRGGVAWTMAAVTLEPTP